MFYLSFSAKNKKKTKKQRKNKGNRTDLCAEALGSGVLRITFVSMRPHAPLDSTGYKPIKFK